MVCEKKGGIRLTIDMLKYWRVLLLIVFVLGSILAIGLKQHKYGIEIVYIMPDSPAKEVLGQGMVISQLNGIKINSVEDWNRYSKKGSLSIVADGKEYKFWVNDSLGIEVMDIESTNLNFGLDLRGGTRILLKPTQNATYNTIEQIIATLQTRANIYGLAEIKFYPIQAADGWYVQVEASGVSSGVVNDLLASKGSFEAKVSKPVEIKNNKGIFQLGTNKYDVRVENETIKINNSIIEVNQTFELEGIEFQLANKTTRELIFLASVFKGNDIELIYSDPQHSGVFPQGNVYRFYFVILVSQESANRFAKVTTAIPYYMDPFSGEYYLKNSDIYLYLDNKLESSLRIASDLGGKAYTTPQIEGSRESREEAVKEKLKLQTILRSGALPVSLETAGISIISPTLGLGFLQSAIFAALIASIVVVIIIFVRYRKFKITIPLVLIGLSEVIIILGVAASNDSPIWGSILPITLTIVILAWIKEKEVDISAWIGAILIPLIGMMSWTIDLAAIGGMIAVIGTGMDHVIVITDETLARKEKVVYTFKERIKRAFFIIFCAAATITAAMLPLIFITAGIFIRGFAITTIVGVLIGILITRPAYARIIEAITE